MATTKTYVIGDTVAFPHLIMDWRVAESISKAEAWKRVLAVAPQADIGVHRGMTAGSMRKGGVNEGYDWTNNLAVVVEVGSKTIAIYPADEKFYVIEAI